MTQIPVYRERKPMITFEEIRADRYSLREVEGVEGIYKVYIPEDIPFQLNKTTTATECERAR